MNHTPQGLIEMSLKRACRLHALSTLISGTDEEIDAFAGHLHHLLDHAIQNVLEEMETKLRINESLTNPKIAQ